MLDVNPEQVGARPEHVDPSQLQVVYLLEHEVTFVCNEQYAGVVQVLVL